MSRYFRRFCRGGNRSFLSTIFYLVVVVFIFCLFTTQFSVGRPNDPFADRNQPIKSQYSDINRPQQTAPLGVPQRHSDHLNDRFEEPRQKPRNEHKPRQNNVDRVVVPQKQHTPAVYPQFAKNGKFVPSRRIVHLDLKGGAYKPEFFPKLFDFLKRTQFTGIILEWEDMFPFTGQLSKATNGYVYSIEDVRSILQAAKDRDFEVIPLVQTLGHLEWVLKLEEFTHLRDDPNSPTVICVGKEGVFELIKDMIDQVAQVHKEFGFAGFHIGADEAFQFGFCNETVERIRTEGNRDRAMLWHLARVAEHVKTTYSTDVLAWHDMIFKDMYLPITTWFALKPFKRVWGASVWKGADGPMQYHSHPMHYIRNQESWVSSLNPIYRSYCIQNSLTVRSKTKEKVIRAELLGKRKDSNGTLAELVEHAKKVDTAYQRSKASDRLKERVKAGTLSGKSSKEGSYANNLKRNLKAGNKKHSIMHADPETLQRRLLRQFKKAIDFDAQTLDWSKLSHQQFSRVYKDFERIEGIVFSGWSRYDHMAMLCELGPVAFPQLAFSHETILEARPMNNNYPLSKQWLGCEPAIEKGAYAIGCTFPGSKLYELVNDYASRKFRALKYIEGDYDFNGWLSRVAVNYSISAGTTIEKIIPNLDFHLSGLEFVVDEFRKEAAKIYYQETIDEYIFVYMSETIELLRTRRKAAMELRTKRSFPKRPYVVYPKTEL